MEEPQDDLLKCIICGEKHKIGGANLCEDWPCDTRGLNLIKIRLWIFTIAVVYVIIWSIGQIAIPLFEYLNSQHASNALILGNALVFVGIYFIGIYFKFSERMDWFFGWSSLKLYSEKFGSVTVLKSNTEVALFHLGKYFIIGLFLLLPVIKRTLSHIPYVGDFESLNYFTLFVVAGFYWLTLHPFHSSYRGSIAEALDALEKWKCDLSHIKKYDEVDKILKERFFGSEMVLFHIRYKDPNKSWESFVLRQIYKVSQELVDRDYASFGPYHDLFQLIDDKLTEHTMKNIKDLVVDFNTLIFSSMRADEDEVLEIVKMLEKIYEEIYFSTDGRLKRLEKRIENSKIFVRQFEKQSMKEISPGSRIKFLEKILKNENKFKYKKQHGLECYKKILILFFDIDDMELYSEEFIENKMSDLKRLGESLRKLILTSMESESKDISEVIKILEKFYEELYSEVESLLQFEHRILRLAVIRREVGADTMRNIVFKYRMEFFEKVMNSESDFKYKKQHGMDYYLLIITIFLELNEK